MREREAVERVISRIYKDRLMRTGRLPKGEDVRKIEKDVCRAAKEGDCRRKKDGN